MMNALASPLAKLKFAARSHVYGCQETSLAWLKIVPN